LAAEKIIQNEGVPLSVGKRLALGSGKEAYSNVFQIQLPPATLAAKYAELPGARMMTNVSVGRRLSVPAWEITCVPVIDFQYTTTGNGLVL
jgi:hypothetical protein